MPGDFIQTYIAMVNLDEKLEGALQPDMATPDAGRLYYRTVV